MILVTSFGQIQHGVILHYKRIAMDISKYEYMLNLPGTRQSVGLYIITQQARQLLSVGCKSTLT
jgi:hypothetical protein